MRDSRYGLAFDIGNYDPTPTPINLTITNVVGASGSFTLVIDNDTWDLIEDEVGLDIANINGIGYSGRIKISFPVDGATPANDLIIFLLFLVRSDAVVNN